MDPRKRPRIDVDLSSEDERPAKRFKKNGYCFSEEEASILLRAKRVFYFDNNISSFTLPPDCCTLEHIKRLNRALLEPSNNLLTFNMTPMSELMSFERVGSVLQSFCNNETLTALNIKRVSLNLTDLSPILKKKRLQSLTISKTFGLMVDFAQIAKDLIGCTSLTHLDLSYCPKSNLNGIEEVIAKHRQLQSLVLSHNTMHNLLPPIIKAIGTSTSLNRLELANTDLTDANAISLAQVLETNRTITYLDISDNSFLPATGCNAIIKMLGRNKRITTLKIKGMSFNDNEVELFKALEKSNTVECVTVSIKSLAGVNQLGLSLENWSALLDLTMTYNEIGQASSFLHGIEKSKTLQRLGIYVIWPNSEEGIEKIKKAFGNNTTLNSISNSYHPTLSQFFEQMTERNKSKKTDKGSRQEVLDLMSLIKESLRNGTKFEDVLSETDYTPDDYEFALKLYITLANASEQDEKDCEVTAKKELKKLKTSREALKTKIEAAQREIDEAKRNLKLTVTSITTMKSNLKKAQAGLQFKVQSREKAEDTLKKLQETTNAFLQQVQREVASWTIDEVCVLLRYLKLYAHASIFADNLIKGDVLVKLTSPDFHQLGLTYMEAKSIMSALYKLKHFKSLTNMPQDCPLEWTNNEVIAWLKSNALEHLSELFQSSGITGNELIVLDNYDLIHWLQIKFFADKTALEAAIQKLREKIEGPANNNNNNIAKEKVPKQFLCPITHEIMKDPVSTIDGHTYERTAIESWLKDHDTSPLTNEKLSSKMLIPNHQLKSLIAEYVKE